MEIWVVRHGETYFNRQRIVQGKGVNSSLNATGLAQAAGFYNTHKHAGFDQIYISTLKRTYQSVAAFINDGIPYQQHDGLDEISWGIHEGQKSDAASYNDFRDLLKKWEAGDISARITGGESPEEVQLRQRDFLSLMEQSGREKILICSHGRSMRILLCTMLGQPLNNMGNFPHHNLGLYVLSGNAGEYSISRFNDLSHLD